MSVVKVISLGFVDRFDIYGLALMIFGSFVRRSLYALLLAKMISGGKDPMGDPRVSRCVCCVLTGLLGACGTLKNVSTCLIMLFVRSDLIVYFKICLIRVRRYRARLCFF